MTTAQINWLLLANAALVRRSLTTDSYDLPVPAVLPTPDYQEDFAVAPASYPLMPSHITELLRVKNEKVLVDNEVVKDGDLIVLTIGEPIGKSGGTNTMKIVRVGEQRKK